MGVDVSLAWATPAQSLDLTTYHEGGIRPKDTFNVQLYERNVQVANLRSIDAPVLLDIIQRALPEGGTLRIMEHTVEASEARWIADPFIDQLRSELAEKEEGKEVEAEKRKRQGQAKLEASQGYRQQGEEAFQGCVQDAQHRLRFRQDDQAHAPHWIQEGPHSQ